MTDHPPDPDSPERDVVDDTAPMPRWVPVAIGVVLVTLAALAVITGLRYRDQTLVNMIRPHRPVVHSNAPAPPGEPEPGASLISGDASNVPAAREPVNRADVTKMVARRGLRTNVTPSDAIVYVNDVAIGQARQFDSQDEEYDFAEPGSYTVRIDAPGYQQRVFVVTASDDAPLEVAHIEAKLTRLGAAGPREVPPKSDGAALRRPGAG